MQTMQASSDSFDDVTSDSFDDVTQPLAANRLEQQRSLASANVLESSNYDSMKLDMLRLLCGEAHDNRIKTRSRGINGQLVSKAKKDLILELKNAATMPLKKVKLQSKIPKFFKPLAEKSASASSNDIAQPLVSNTNDYDSADLASDEELVAEK